MKQWEYCVVKDNADFYYREEVGGLEEQMDELGKKGWELVSASCYLNEMSLIFKRPIVGEVNEA